MTGRLQGLILLAAAALFLATLACPAHAQQSLFGSGVQLPEGARQISSGFSTRLSDLVRRRALLTASSGYGYGGYGYGGYSSHYGGYGYGSYGYGYHS